MILFFKDVIFRFHINVSGCKPKPFTSSILSANESLFWVEISSSSKFVQCTCSQALCSWSEMAPVIFGVFLNHWLSVPRISETFSHMQQYAHVQMIGWSFKCLQPSKLKNYCFFSGKDFALLSTHIYFRWFIGVSVSTPLKWRSWWGPSW